MPSKPTDPRRVLKDRVRCRARIREYSEYSIRVLDQEILHEGMQPATSRLRYYDVTVIRIFTPYSFRVKEEEELH